jgi:hypothetical protein
LILLLPGNARSLRECITLNPAWYGWLLTPRRTMTKTRLWGLPLAVDNECYTLGDKFKPLLYLFALWRVKEAHRLNRFLFATAPDVPYDARATLDRAGPWLRVIRDLRLPAALVAQDGMESLAIPWDKLDCLFIGGSTSWKLEVGPYLVREARKEHKWTHIGRVNSVHRAARLQVLPDSVDGTAWAKHPTEYARQWELWLQAGRPSMARLF